MQLCRWICRHTAAHRERPRPRGSDQHVLLLYQLTSSHPFICPERRRSSLFNLGKNRVPQNEDPRNCAGLWTSPPSCPIPLHSSLILVPVRLYGLT
uniref:Uncharacterized protein n=1 Tax=Anguilla anguilla TaxID=7936 RepID=A0A0E9WUT1_ANGAN